jgi:hypothetical protein
VKVLVSCHLFRSGEADRVLKSVRVSSVITPWPAKRGARRKAACVRLESLVIGPQSRRRALAAGRISSKPAARLAFRPAVDGQRDAAELQVGGE